MKALKKLSKLLLLLLMFHKTQEAKAFVLSDLCDPFNEITCKSPVIYIHDTLIGDSTNILFDINITALQPGFGTTSLLNLSGVPIANTTFFTYKGFIIFNSFGSLQRYHVFKFTYSAYIIPPSSVLVFNLKAPYPGNTIVPFHLTYLSGLNFPLISRGCKPCPLCPNRKLMQEFFELQAPILGLSSTNFSSLSIADQNAMATLLNWILDDPFPTTADYNNVMDTTLVTMDDMPPSFCPSSNITCPCLNEIYDHLIAWKNDLINVIGGTMDLNDLSVSITIELFTTCTCLYNYCVAIEPDGAGGYVLILFPHTPYMPTWHLQVAADGSFTICSADDFTIPVGAAADFEEIALASGGYNPVTNDLECYNGFTTYDTAYVDSICSIVVPCENCIGSFAPEPDKKYLLSAWVRENGAPATKTSYTFPKIDLIFTDPPTNSFTTTFTATPSGIIIDGWQRVEFEFVIPTGSTQMEIKLLCTTGDCFFDDIRVFPFDGSMKSYVYDPITLRLVAELDERNYATFYEYDEEGKLTRIKKETERGIMTIQESKTTVVKK